MARVSITTDAVKATQTADIVIEAIAEDIKLKLKLFAELDAAAPAYVVVFFFRNPCCFLFHFFCVFSFNT